MPLIPVWHGHTVALLLCSGLVWTVDRLQHIYINSLSLWRLDVLSQSYRFRVSLPLMLRCLLLTIRLIINIAELWIMAEMKEKPFFPIWNADVSWLWVKRFLSAGLICDRIYRAVGRKGSSESRPQEWTFIWRSELVWNMQQRRVSAQPRTCQ